MGLTGTRTYVGFGFGAIQAGLFLYEAYRSGTFARLVVAEVLPDMVAGLRRTGGNYSLNIAHPDRVETLRIGPVEVYDPSVADDRERLVAALIEAQEIGTAIPSVTYYRSAGPGSLHCLLAQGLSRKANSDGPAAVVYAAENHNHAAQILEASVLGEVPPGEQNALRARVQFLNTVIGKMSGVVSDSDTIKRQGLAAITPRDLRAFLVEVFNRILISKIHPRAGDEAFSFQRGIEVFEEKENLLPFEEAKLYGHNATHALAAYVGALAGARRITDVAQLPGALPFLRAAFLQESGQALIAKNAGVDPLFSQQGYEQYADDLLARMTNPHLLDTVERVGRDPARKLGWNDRLVGTMRLALGQGIEPRRYAFGAAAALSVLDPSVLDQAGAAGEALAPLWRDASPSLQDQEAVLDRIETALGQLGAWLVSGCGDLERVFGRDADD